MKSFVGYIANKIVKSIPRKKKVSPDIKSVEPTKDIKGSIKRTKRDAFIKNIDDLDKAQKKIREGKKMMKEGQKTRKQMTGTGRAFQFKNMKSYHAVQPGDKDKFKSNIRQEKTKKFKKGKELEKKADGGRIGRRFGSPKPKTNVQKIKETFSSKKNLSPKQMKIAKLAGNPNKIDAADLKKLRNR
tara:strand:- start:26 stop:583 length:558 start_codon:yes stop_codon:yes gene_type:complete